MKRILVTGGAGFIGSHLVEYHLSKGDEVWVIDNFTTGSKHNITSFLQKKNFRVDAADVLTFDALQQAVNWCDRIYHAAASVGMMNVLKHPTETLSNNIHTTEKILQAMTKAHKKVRCLIISSSGVYSHLRLNGDGKCYEDVDLKMPSGASIQECYSLSKIVGEVMALSYQQQKGVDCVIARVFNTIGLRQSRHYGMVVPRFIHQALQGEEITVYGDGSQTRSFCNVHDVVYALDLLLESDATKGQIFNVGNDEEVSILHLAELIKKKTASSSKIVLVPYKEAYGMEFADVSKRRPSLAKLQQMVGCEPQWSLDQTLDEIIEDLRKKEGSLRKKAG